MTPSLLLLAACTPIDHRALDQVAWAEWMSTPIQLQGVVSGPDGPLANARVSLPDQVTTTDEAGAYRFEDVARDNLIVQVDAAGFHGVVRPAWLTRTLDVESATLDIALEPVQPSVARLLFGGDVMFGRRFVDVDGNTDRYDAYPQRADALVPSDAPAAGARGVMERVAGLLASSDFASVNLETPLIRTPQTPHPEKPFIFYSDPATLGALKELGVDFAGLGNNHVYDYLEDGLRQTLDAAVSQQMPHAGAGTTIADAWAPWRHQVRDVPLAYHAATSIDGFRWDPAFSYIAEPTKGGAANLQSRTQIDAALGSSVEAGDHLVVQVHTGVEYAYGPTERVREHVDNVIAAGAELVIGHHPHTAQGFAEREGVFVAWSLGNLAFDGLRLETLLGAVVEVDFSGSWERARVYPVYLEDYRPRHMTGPDASRSLRQMSEFSEGLVVLEEAGVGRIVRSGEVVWQRRTLTVDVPLDERGRGILDLRDHATPDESALRVDLPGGATARFGRDLMGYSDFEDLDVDEDQFEVARWDHTPDSLFPCRTRRTGVAGLCSERSYTDLDVSVAPFRNRIRVFGDAEGTPEKDLTLFGWHHGFKAGAIEARVEYHASFGETVFGEEAVGELPGGNFDWQPFAFDLNLPPDLTDSNDPEANPRAVRLFLEQDIPRVRGDGLAALDDLAMIGWSNTFQPAPLTRDTSHPSDFVQVQGAANASVTVTVELGRPTL